MKILFLRAKNPYFEHGASANRFRGLIDGMRSHGYTIDIAIAGGIVIKNEDKECEEGILYLSKANYYSYWLCRANKYLLKIINNLIANRNFNKIDISKYDIVWITKDDQVLSLFLKNKNRITCPVFMELNEFNDIYLSHSLNKFQYWDAVRANNLFIKVVRCVDCFGVMTQKLIDYYKIMAKPEAKFMLLPMTVDFNRFQNVSSKNILGSPYIAFTGCMDKNKDGVDILIKAFAKIADKYPAISLLLAGFYSHDTPGLLTLISNLGLEQRIKYIGQVSRDEIPSIICGAAVLALSRPDSHQAQGGFPTKLGEYLATGNPVCVTKVGEIPDYLEDKFSAYIAMPGDVDSFADALDRALSDTAKAKLVGMNGRKVAEENFDAQIQARHLAGFFESCCTVPISTMSNR